MEDLIFKREHAVAAMHSTDREEPDWLYQAYPKPGGRVKSSSTGFLVHDGKVYSLKPLGRLANEIAGLPVVSNPHTSLFRKYFRSLGFQILDNSKKEADEADARQKRLAKIWMRKGQARFRKAVFDLYGPKCLITGSTTLASLEAAHIRPVAKGGTSRAWDGIPLRADIHRLFDAGLIKIDVSNWKVVVRAESCKDYIGYAGLDLSGVFAGHAKLDHIRSAFAARGINRHG